MTRMWFGAENCQGATSDVTGRHYTADKKGFVEVSDPRDVALFKRNGYQEAGGMPHLSKFWVCDDCSWEATVNHCRYCDSENLRKVEA